MEWLEIAMPILLVLLSGLGYVIKKKYFEKEPEPERSIKTQFRNENRVKRIISNIRSLLNADRVTIKSFHNGDQSTTGIHFLKMTMTFEVPAAGIANIQKDMANQLTSHYSDSLTQLMDDGCVRFTSDELSELSGVMRSYGTKTLYWFAITDERDEPVGIMGIHFRTDKELKVPEIKNIHKFCDKVSGHLITIQYESKLENA